MRGISRGTTRAKSGNRSMRIAVALLLLAFGCSGCTITGTLIGAAIPEYRPIRDLQPAVGSTTRVYDERGEMLAAGTLDGYENGEVLIHDGSTHFRVRLDRIAWAERQVGGHERLGFYVGLAADIGIFVATMVGIYATSVHPNIRATF